MLTLTEGDEQKGGHERSLKVMTICGSTQWLVDQFHFQIYTKTKSIHHRMVTLKCSQLTMFGSQIIFIQWEEVMVSPDLSVGLSCLDLLAKRRLHLLSQHLTQAVLGVEGMVVISDCL